MKGMRFGHSLAKFLASFFTVVLLGTSLAFGETFPSLGAAADYAVLGIGGTNVTATSDFEVYQSATVINGNVGVGPYSLWTHGMDATINGRLDYDLTDGLPVITGTITGGTHQVDMTAPVADARAASYAASLLTPTLTLATLTEDQVLTSAGGLNVIRLTDDLVLKKTLTIQGSASDFFVFQLTAADAASAKTLEFSGLQMSLSGGITADHIMWNLYGTGGQVSISSGANVSGIFLAPDRGITVDNATIYGSVIGGGGVGDDHSSFLSVHSSSEINQIPEPTTFATVAGSIMLLVCTLRRRRR